MPMDIQEGKYICNYEFLSIIFLEMIRLQCFHNKEDKRRLNTFQVKKFFFKESHII